MAASRSTEFVKDDAPCYSPALTRITRPRAASTPSRDLDPARKILGVGCDASTPTRHVPQFEHNKSAHD